MFNFLFIIVSLILGYILGFGDYYWLVFFLYVIATFIPFLAVTVRRLHDVGKSGWFFFIFIIIALLSRFVAVRLHDVGKGGWMFFISLILLVGYLVGLVWLLILLIRDSQPGVNKWGKNPKEINE